MRRNERSRQRSMAAAMGRTIASILNISLSTVARIMDASAVRPVIVTEMSGLPSLASS
jgi:hypothetical protein